MVRLILDKYHIGTKGRLMPTYLFYDKEENEYFEIVMKISEYVEFMESNNEKYERIIEAPSIVSGTSYNSKVPEGFKEVLSKISDKYPDSNLANKYRKKTIKEVKTRDIVEKHVERISKRVQ